ncbi:MAG: alpha/beta hydrolase [Phototrophicaceae bacterium]
MTSTYGSAQIPTQLKVIRIIMHALGTISPSLAGYLALRLFSTPLKRDKISLEHQPRTIQLSHKNYKLVGYEWHGTGSTIMLIHGWEASAARFKKLINLLVEHNFHVVAMDAPAHGASSGIQASPFDYSECLYQFTKEVGKVDAIIAHSFGGVATMLLLDTYPDFQVDKVVLVASANHVIDAIGLFASIIHLPQAAFQKMQDHLIKRTGRSLESVSPSTIAKTRHEQALIIHDADDKIVTVESGRSISKSWKNSHYLETNKLGHRRILYHQTTLDQIVEFVSS